MFLSSSSFRQVIKHTPLISIDLIVRNKDNYVLLGERKNRPAQGFWFVPGGRIFKNETIQNALQRTIKDELSMDFDKGITQYHGVYEHFYEDNFSDTTFGTHYIVLAYVINLVNVPLKFPTSQHAKYKWFTIPDLCNDTQVHHNTKLYFK